MQRNPDQCWVDRQNRVINGLQPKYCFDPEKWYLGSLCKNFCIFPGTTKSLRLTLRDKHTRKRLNHCACKYYGKDWLFRFLDQSSIGVDTEKYRLGSLCKNNHNWMGTNKSFRWINGGRCLECEALRRQNPERKKRKAELSKQWYEANKELSKIRSKENSAKRKAENPHGEKIKRTLNKHKRKARLNAAHTVKITDGEIRLHVKINYQGECIYCKSKEKIVHDHFVPLAKGGPHVLGNIVPACNHCNSSKRDKDPKRWYFEQPFATTSGWKAILKKLNIEYRDNDAQLSLL